MVDYESGLRTRGFCLIYLLEAFTSVKVLPVLPGLGRVFRLYLLFSNLVQVSMCILCTSKGSYDNDQRFKRKCALVLIARPSGYFYHFDDFLFCV